MTSALIGATGFVGSNLARQHHFDEHYNSKNVEQLAGRSFNLVVCAGARAEKWKANAEPAADRANIDRLVRALDQVEAEQVVLISTVDVFANPVAVDEDSPAELATLHAYGKHRRLLEELVAARFDATIVRLPGLYGAGLKKNVIFDFLHDHETEKIDSRGSFQFYGVDRLWRDISIARTAGLSLVHLATEPTSVADVALEGFGMRFENHVAPAPARYDLRTKFASLFGQSGNYVQMRDQVLAEIRAFVDRERAGARAVGGRRA